MMLQRFKDFIIEKKLFLGEKKVLVAVSGGIDSIVLCHLLHQINIPIAIAHCNFGLRDEESDGDENFVKLLAETYNIPFFVKKFNTTEFAGQYGISIQMAARDLRYTWFNEILIKQSFDFIATAHHANDSVETIILNLTRGTGISGLHGISFKAGNLIRPLLPFTKLEILEYATNCVLSYREDSSNASNKYYRNLIRNEVVPLLKKINPSIEKSMLQTIEKIDGVEQFFLEKLHDIRTKILTIHGQSILIDIPLLLHETQVQTILYYLLKPFGFEWIAVKNIIECMHGISGKKFLTQSHELIKDRDNLILSPLNVEGPNPTIELPFLENSTVIKTANFTIHKQLMRSIEFKMTTTPSIAALDLDKTGHNFILRVWREGDKFHPLGMTGAKKVSDFLIDLKISVFQKKRISILVNKGEILWIVGFRTDKTYKITDSTKKILIATFTPLIQELDNII